MLSLPKKGKDVQLSSPHQSVWKSKPLLLLPPVLLVVLVLTPLPLPCHAYFLPSFLPSWTWNRHSTTRAGPTPEVTTGEWSTSATRRATRPDHKPANTATLGMCVRGNGRWRGVRAGCTSDTVGGQTTPCAYESSAEQSRAQVGELGTRRVALESTHTTPPRC